MALWYIIPFGKPRIISCAELHAQHVALPRGCFDDVVTCLTDHGFCLSPQCGQGPTASLPVVRRKCQWPVRFQASIEGRDFCDWCCIVCPLLCGGRGIAFPGCVGYHALTFKFDDRVLFCQEAALGHFRFGVLCITRWPCDLQSANNVAVRTASPWCLIPRHPQRQCPPAGS